MPPHFSQRLTRPLMAAASLGAALALSSSPAVQASTSPPPSADTTVAFRGWTTRVPAAWPVVDLGADPSRCVRFDLHAAYLGSPGAHQACPTRQVGRTDALLVEPIELASDAPAVDRTSSSAAVTDPFDAAVLAKHELRVAIPKAGVVVTVTWADDPSVAQRVLAAGAFGSGATTASNPPPATPAPARARTASSDAPLTVGVDGFVGKAFDTCGAPSLSDVDAWKASPYRAIGTYIGGANRGCAQPNLTSSWVRQIVSSGWKLLPIYVGLQAPAACGCAEIDPANAASQGAAAADDAAWQAATLAMGSGSTIFYDMEGYAQSSANTTMVLRFLSAWTARLHTHGYRSGVYSSASSGVYDLAHAGSSVSRPDVIWFARWNDQPTTTGEPAIPESVWRHARVHQYATGTETWGGVTISIDSNAVDVSAATSTPPPPPNPWLPFATARALVQQQYQDVLRRPASTSEADAWVWQLAGGSTPGEVMGPIVGSAEADQKTNSTIRLYVASFGRIPDHTGLLYWTFRRAAGDDLVRVATAFADSAEFRHKYGSLSNRSFTSQIYRSVLGRTADPGGLSYWTRRLDAGISRGALVAGLSDAPEYRSTSAGPVVIAALFEGLLRRQVDPVALWYYVDGLNRGGTVARAANALFGSVEYRSRF
ncbi:MAG: hypothetical protein JWN46_242 [Acidimicrobiales bacterium]|nr:hypothetical protein [Acidimicrobiales bacterium]